MAKAEAMIRIQGMDEVNGPVEIGPKSDDPNIVIISGQDGDSVWLSRDGAAIAAKYLQEWAKTPTE